uniref:Uncharacterized protein n=1 Tax=Micrurus carvalhoi TaxID=3147026 RepID=A0A2H6ND92_9SAUR
MGPMWGNLGLCQYTGTPAYNRCVGGTIARMSRIIGTNRVRLVWNVQNGNFSQSMGIGIDGTGTDPISYITIKQTQFYNRTDIEWSVYDTLARAGKQPIVSEKS